MVYKSEMQMFIESLEDPVQINCAKILKSLNKKAYLFIQKNLRSGMTKAYRMLQKEDCWKSAKNLLRVFRECKGPLKCDHCLKPLPKWYVLHHESYGKGFTDYFNPLYLEMLCGRCHKEVHGIG